MRHSGNAGLLGAMLLVGVVVSGCGASTVTGIPTGTVGPTATATPHKTTTAAPTATPEATVTEAATESPSAVPSASPSAVPSASASASPAPTLPAAVVPCTGGPTTKAWLADQISKLKFTIYCPVLPAGWGVVKMTASYDAPGLYASYKNGANTIEVWEGNVCSLSPNPCTGMYSPDLGNQPFGPLAGDMSGSAGLFNIVVHTAKPTILYTMVGNGMTQGVFKSYSASMHALS